MPNSYKKLNWFFFIFYFFLGRRKTCPYAVTEGSGINCCAIPEDCSIGGSTRFVKVIKVFSHSSGIVGGIGEGFGGLKTFSGWFSDCSAESTSK